VALGLIGLSAAARFAVPWLISFAMLAALIWAFGRRKGQ
jgi:hypothetical protein